MRGQRWLIQGLNGLILLLVGWLLLAAAYVSLGRLLVPTVANYQQELVTQVEQLTGRHIELRSLQGQMQGAQPVLTLRGLRVHESQQPDSEVLFDLDDVTARLNVWRSLWLRRPVMDALQIRGLALSLSEDEQGQWHMQGLGERTRRLGALEQAIGTLKQQRRITLLDTRIEVSPFEEPRWQFEHGDLTLLNGDGWHRLDGHLSLPDGERLRWQVSALLPGEQLSEASLGFFLELPASDWSRWLPHDWLERTHLRELTAGGRFWGSWQDQRLQRLQGTLIAPQIRLQNGEREPVLHDLFSRFEYVDDRQTQQLQVQDLSLHLGEEVWPTTRLQLERDIADGHWSVALDRLRLAKLSTWLTRLAPDQPVAELVGELAPEGTLRQVRVNGIDPAGDLTSLDFSGRLEEVGMAAFHNAPSFSGVSGTVQGSPQQGELRVDAQQWSMQLPNLFPEPWQYQRAQGLLNWHWSKEQGLQLDSPGIAVSGEDGDASATLSLHLPPTGQTPTMDLQVALRNSQAPAHRAYLPVRSQGFSPALATWMAASGVQGQVPLAIFEYHGSLLKGASAEEREIALYAQLRSGELVFQSGWPPLTELDADLLLRGGALDIRASNARLLGAQAHGARVHGQLMNTTGPLQLQVESAFEGSVSDALKLMQDSPLAELTGNPLAGWSGEGAVSGELQLTIPLRRSGEQAAQTQALVEWQLADAQVNIPVLQAPLEAIDGQFRFARGEGLSADTLSARFLGASVEGQLTPLGERGQRLQLRGRHRVEQLRRWALLEAVPASLLSGELGWQARVDLQAGRQQVRLRSDLKGLVLSVPEPFAKDAKTPRPLQADLTLANGQQRWQIQSDDGLQAVLRYRGGELAGDVRYASGAPSLPQAPGINLQASLPVLDWDQWRQWLSGLQSSGAARPRQLSGSLGQLQVRADRFVGMGLELDNLQARVGHGNAGWQIDVEQSDVAGQVLVPDADGEPIRVDLSRLRLPRAESADAPPLPQPGETDAEPVDRLAGIKPSTLPSLDVNVDQLSWGADPIGAARFALRPDATGAHLPQLDVDLRGLRIKGSMDWREAPAHTVFEGSLEADDIGEVLKNWRYASTITSNSFVTNAALNWPGSPAAFALRTSSGTLGIEARDGMLQSGEGSAEALRVFGLLNFNALTRRLRLDFSDLFSKGTAYDSLDAGLYVENGVLHSEQPVVLEGPGVKLQLEGKLNLRSNQADMGLLVTLPVTNNLPLAAIIAGAPQIGGVLFLADKILGDKVARFASVKYRISGDWQKPNVEFDRAFDDKAALEEE